MLSKRVALERRYAIIASQAIGKMRLSQIYMRRANQTGLPQAALFHALPNGCLVHSPFCRRAFAYVNAIIAKKGLRWACDYRISHRMNNPKTYADAVIDALGGTSKVASLIEAPVSTVHSWRRIGIPPSRLAHLKLLAQVEGKELPPEMVA